MKKMNNNHSKLPQEFFDYKENLEKFPYYTFLNEEDKKNLEYYDKPFKQMSPTFAKKHPYLWTKWIVGVTPYDYQFKMLDYMMKSKRLAVVSGRQIGKSFSIAAFSFWAAYNNVFPIGVDKRTRIGIVSSTDKQAKKLLKDIVDLVSLADGVIARLSKGTDNYDKKYFTNRMATKPTIYKVEWSGGVIEVFVPTNSFRGYTFSFVFIDEADWLESEDPDRFFNSIAMPTVKKFDGNVLMFSTPKGTRTFFYDIIKPDDEKPAEGWDRLWIAWTFNENDWATGWKERKDYLSRGKDLDFQIEYEAQFKSGKYTFFPEYIIDQCVSSVHKINDYFFKPVTVGLDFGDTHSRTVITIVHKNPETEKVELIWHKEFQGGYDNSLLPAYFEKLKENFPFIKEIIADDCVGGKVAIELLRRNGWNVKPFVFKKSKQEYYELTKTAFSNQRVVLYYAPEIIGQLKSIESHLTDMGNLQIKKPKGINDDIVDSLVMALSPHINFKKIGRRMVL